VEDCAEVVVVSVLLEVVDGVEVDSPPMHPVANTLPIKSKRIMKPFIFFISSHPSNALQPVFKFYHKNNKTREREGLLIISSSLEVMVLKSNLSRLLDHKSLLGRFL